MRFKDIFVRDLNGEEVGCAEPAHSPEVRLRSRWPFGPCCPDTLRCGSPRPLLSSRMGP